MALIIPSLTSLPVPCRCVLVVLGAFIVLGTVLDVKQKWNRSDFQGSDLQHGEAETNGGFNMQEKSRAEITLDIGAGERQTSFINKNGGACAMDAMPKEDDGDEDDEQEGSVIVSLIICVFYDGDEDDE